MVEQQVLVLLSGKSSHRLVVGSKNGRLAELEQRRHQFVPRNQVEKLCNTTKSKMSQPDERVVLILFLNKKTKNINQCPLFFHLKGTVGRLKENGRWGGTVPFISNWQD